MNKSILALFLIFALCASASAFRMKYLRLARGLPLTYHQDTGTYRVRGYFADSGKNQTNNNGIDLQLALYTTHNFINKALTTSFELFSSSDSQFIQVSQQDISFTTPYYNVSGKSGYVPITLTVADGTTVSVGAATANSAQYGNGANAILASACDSNPSEMQGSGAYGQLGMSVSNMAANGMGSIFSVFIDPASRNGMALLDKDLSLSRSLWASAEWNTNGSWVYTGNLGFKVGKNEVATGNYNLLIDINSNITGLPRDAYNKVINALAAYGVNGCTNVNFKPVCNYNGRIRDLPHIQLTGVGAKNDHIHLPPQIYVVNNKVFDGVTTQITLNIKALNVTSDDVARVQNTTHTQDIIIDASILSLYYATFEANSDGSGTISLWRSNAGYPKFYFQWARWAKILFVVILSVVILLACASCFFCCCRRRVAAARANAAIAAK